MLKIKKFAEEHWKALWEILRPVLRSGETLAYSPDITEQETYQAWIVKPEQTYVALNGQGDILGTYYLKQNQPALGGHVCNCGYLVADKARGQGIASLMCDHSQSEALALGFLAMQFNLVVSTNKVAIYLWQKHGFKTVGTLPGAFRHPKHGFVDAYVMYKWLE